MPQVLDTSDPNFLEQWASLGKPLGNDELEVFLRHVFANLARRPEALRLRAVAAVARRIRWLVDFGVPKEVIAAGPEAVANFQGTERSADHKALVFDARRTAEILWGNLMLYGEIEPCSTEQALAYVRRNGDTHLANPYLNATIEFLERFELPSGARNPFTAPYLQSKSMSAQGGNPNPHLTDDLSERIYGADHALRRTGLKRWRPLIARVLNEAKAPKRRSRLAWGAEDVSNRVKEYETAQRHSYRDVAQLREQIANRLIFDFRWAELIETQNRARQVEQESRGPVEKLDLDSSGLILLGNEEPGS
jgi:hypothetical protein